MWQRFGPLCDAREAENAAAEAEIAAAAEPEPAPPQLQGLPANTDSILDPDYSEADPGKQLRDGLLWVAFEFLRVISDTDAGPVADISAASKPPPNAFALLILSSYALSGADKRRELITRALAFATKSHSDSAPAAANVSSTEQAGGFLHEIGGQSGSDGTWT